MVYRFSPGCCCGDCVIFVDDFNRADSTAVDGWTEVSGDWSILSNQLHETGTVGATIIANAASPDVSFYVAVDVPSVAENAIYRVIVNYVDASNYHFAEFEFLIDTLKIRLYKRSGGTNTQLVSKEWGDVEVVGIEESFLVCFSSKIFYASQKYAPYCAWIVDPIAHATGKQAGLGNGSSVTIDYDNFSFERSGDTVVGCLVCGCRCNGDPLPMTVHAQCTFGGNFSPCLPVDVTLDALTIGSPHFFATVEWYGSALVDCLACPGILDSFTVSVSFRCGCTSDGSKDFQIWCDIEEGSQKEACDQNYTCNPTDIVFNTLVWTGYGGNCSNESGGSVDVDIEVTE